MKVTENASKDMFELLRLAFGEESEKLDSVKKEVKHSILTGSSKWSAKIDIEVVEAQGLTGKDKSGGSNYNRTIAHLIKLIFNDRYFPCLICLSTSNI